MEENKLELVKPEFKGEIQAKIKSVGEIESNMKEVKGYVEELNNYYKNINFTEETMKEAKDEKAKVNKFKLTETYNTINKQVVSYEDEQKRKKEQQIKDYFEEYKTANNIDFITYEQANINITLNASLKSLKGQAKTFVDKIADDLRLIEAQECKEEILVEYKQNLNVSRAIQEVANRHKLLEEEKRKQEEKVVTIVSNENHEITKESHEQLEEVFNKPLEQPEEVKQEEILTLKFIRTTRRSKTRRNINT